MAMVTPSQPGGIVNGQSLEMFGPTVGNPACGLVGVRQAHSAFVNGNSGVPVEPARWSSEALGAILGTQPGGRTAYDSSNHAGYLALLGWQLPENTRIKHAHLRGAGHSHLSPSHYVANACHHRSNA